MSDINSSVNESRRAGVVRAVKHNLRIDMTPMVDLGFLLISFFVITAKLAEPTAMNLYMPKDGPPTDLGESTALTILIKEDRMFYYEGKWEDAFKSNAIKKIEGTKKLRRIIELKQQQLDQNSRIKNGRNDLMMLVKAGNTTTYKTLVDVLDETTISMVKKYALIQLSPEEKSWLYRN